MASDHPVTPLADALAELTDRNLLRLFIPGHSASAAAAPQLADYFGEQLLRRDFGCLVTGLDKGPGSPLEHAQLLAAQAWGAARTWFLTNGASQANRLAALALGQVGDPGQCVVVQRSVHSSVVDGLILAGLDAEFIVPSIDSARGINHGISVDQLAQRLRGVPTAKAVWVVSPSYFGAVADIAGLAQVAHQHGLPLVVDAAWGSHFGFHPQLPENPLRLGADLVISSTHKAAGSLTQSAMLHLGSGPHAASLAQWVDRALPLTASTSVSMPLLASLDIARAAMQSGQLRIAQTMAVAEGLREQLRDHPLLDVVSDGFADFPDIVAHDPMRVSIDVSRLGTSGVEIRQRLAVEHGIYLEIATHRAVVAFFGPGYVPDVRPLLETLHRLATPSGGVETRLPQLPPAGPRRMSPRTAFFAATEVVPWAAAVGRVAADSMSAYPPGIPNVLPGEELTAEVIDFLQATMAVPGGYVRGAVDAAVVRVVRG